MSVQSMTRLQEHVNNNTTHTNSVCDALNTHVFPMFTGRSERRVYKRQLLTHVHEYLTQTHTHNRAQTPTHTHNVSIVVQKTFCMSVISGVLMSQEDLTPVPDVSPGAQCVRVDSRVSADHSQSCATYSQNNHITHGFLFPPGGHHAEYYSVVYSHVNITS